jgi:tetratricopeptide (TPR) repeat protein
MKYKPATIALLLLASCHTTDLPNNPTSQKDSITTIPKNIIALEAQAQKDASNFDAKLAVINALDSAKLYKPLLQQIDKYLVSDSFNNILWQKRGEVLKYIGDTTAAIKAFHYSAKILPSTKVLFELVNLYAETKNITCLKIITHILKSNPGGDYTANCHFFEGVYYSRINNTALAIASLDKAIANDVKFEDAYIEKGFVFFGLHQYEKALEVFEICAKVSPTFSDAYYWQAKCKAALLQKPEAIDLFNKAILLNKNNKEAIEELEKLKK